MPQKKGPATLLATRNRDPAARSLPLNPAFTMIPTRVVHFIAAALGAISALSLPAQEGAALPAEVARMARIGSCSSPAWSPDGRTLAFISNLSGNPQVWTVPSTGGWPTQVTAFDDQVRSLSWSPRGDWLAFTMAPGGGLNTQVYLIRPDGSDVRRLTPGGRVNCNLYDWSRDGRYLAYGTNERDGAAVDVYWHDTQTGQSRLLRRCRGIGAVSGIAPDNSRVVVSQLVSRGRNDLYLVEPASGTETHLTPFDGPGQFSADFTADGRALLLSGNQAGDRIALHRAPLSADGKVGAFVPLRQRADAKLAGFEVAPRGGHVLLHWNAGGKSEAELLDLRRADSGPPLTLPSEIASGFSFSPDGRQLAFAGSGSRRPVDVWTIDLADGALRQVTRSPHAGINLDELVSPEFVRYQAHDGLELTAWLYLPAGFQKPGRVVMSYHGGPESQERPLFNSTYQALLRQGIAVIAPNVRGSAGFGKRFVNLDNGARRVDAVRDIGATLDYLVASKLADPGRIGIMGGSYGGYMVMAGLTEFPDRIAAGVNLFGIVNFETFFRHSEPWMAAISTVEYGDPATEAEMLRSLSPLHRMDRIKAPVLVQHGRNDTNVPFIEAEQVVNTLRARGIPTELVEFPDEGHGFRKTPNRIRSTVTLVEWFQRHL